MGLTNIYAKLIVIAMLLPMFAWGQTTVIPDKLRVKTVPRSPAIKDMMVTVDTLGNIKKDTIPSGGGGSATGVNGLTGTGNIGLGGTLSQNTTVVGGAFNLTLSNNNGLFINNTSGTGNITSFKTNGTTVSEIFPDGVYYGPGFGAFTGRIDAFIATGTTGTAISRNQADNKNAFTVRNLNILSTGSIVSFQNAVRVPFFVGNDGIIGTASSGVAVGGRATAFNIAGGLKPSANNDILTGLRISTTIGTSTISAWGSITGGSGYPNGTQLCNLTGGTGKLAVANVTISGGAVTSVLIADGGINYTPGDVLTIVVVDASGNPVGSGATVTVASITSYTGIVGYALQTDGLDQYDQDYSSTFTGNSKVNKTYVDNRVISGSVSATGSATTTFTVTLGAAQPNNTYKVQVTPTSSIAVGGFYITNKTLTTFQIVYPSGITGLATWDYSVMR